MGALWTFLRLCGIVVGIITLLGFGSGLIHVEFKPFFAEFLQVLQEAINAPLRWIEELLVKPVLEFIRNLGLPLPHPADHWRPVFTLTWLLTAASARNWLPAYIVVQLAWAFVCALIGAVAAGTQPLASAAVAAWPMAAILLYFVGVFGLFGEFRSVLICLGGAAVSLAMGFFITEPLDVLGSDSPALLLLVVIAGGLGLGVLQGGLFIGDTWRERLTNPNTAVGLDIWGVLGGALAIGYFMLK